MEVIEILSDSDDEHAAGAAGAPEVEFLRTKSSEEVQFVGRARTAKRKPLEESEEVREAKARRRREAEEETPAMRRGALGGGDGALGGAAASWSRLGENGRSRLVRGVLWRGARDALDGWRWERDRPDEPLWDVLAACADAFPDAARAARDAGAPATEDADVRRLRARVATYARRDDTKRALLDIEPLEGGGGVACGVCADDFALCDAAPCEGERDVHWFCKPCLRNYMTVTVAAQSGAAVSAIKCMACDALVATANARACLSEWEAAEFDARAAERDASVALQGGASCALRCACGAVGVLMPGDEPADGVLACPGARCDRSYCVKCGDDAHVGAPCPPSTAEGRLLAALGPDTKRCPNCGNGITKLGGCNHVLCAPPAGCGQGFCFTCLQPHAAHDPAKCGDGAMGDAMMRAHNPAAEAELMRRQAEAQLSARREGRPPPARFAMPPRMPPARAAAPPLFQDFHAFLAAARARRARRNPFG